MGAGVGTLEKTRKDLAELPIEERIKRLEERGIDLKDAKIIATQLDEKTGGPLSRVLKDANSVLDATDALKAAGVESTVEDKISVMSKMMSQSQSPLPIDQGHNNGGSTFNNNSVNNMATLNDNSLVFNDNMATLNYNENTLDGLPNMQTVSNNRNNATFNGTGTATTLNDSVYSMAATMDKTLFNPHQVQQGNLQNNNFFTPSGGGGGYGTSPVLERPKTAQEGMMERKRLEQERKDRAYRENVVQSKELQEGRIVSRAVRQGLKQRDYASGFEGCGVRWEDESSQGALSPGGLGGGGTIGNLQPLAEGGALVRYEDMSTPQQQHSHYYGSPQNYQQQIQQPYQQPRQDAHYEQQPWNVSVDSHLYHQGNAQQNSYNLNQHANSHVIVDRNTDKSSNVQSHHQHHHHSHHHQEAASRDERGGGNCGDHMDRKVSFHLSAASSGVNGDVVDDGQGMKSENRKGLMAKGTWRLAEKRELGSGSFGQVYLGLDTSKGSLLAVKKLSLSTSQLDDEDGEHLKELEQEVSLMRSLHHVNVVRYLGAELHREDRTTMLFVLQEWVAGGSLGGIVRAFGPLEQQVCKRYAQGIIEGLAFLHSQSVVHRDLKPDNILISDQGIAKIADFGASKRLNSATMGTLGEKEWSLKGTPFYMSPEQMRQEECGRKSDIWALGGVLLYMATSDFPWRFASGFEKANKMNSFAFFFKVMDNPDTTPLTGIPTDKLSMINQPGLEPMFPFLEQCFERAPSQRPKAVDLLRHPWLQIMKSNR